jgi:hypothetical protein
VGYYTDSTGGHLPLAEHWNGTAWTIQPSPSPGGSEDAIFNAVSCASGTACTAVGSYATLDGTQFTMAEGWNGTAWTALRRRSPSRPRRSCPAGRPRSAKLPACTERSAWLGRVHHP